MARNLVVLCDGTGNEVEGDLSNVLKLYRMALKDDRQHVFYEPGVGTIGDDDAWGRIKQNIRSVRGLAFGVGLDDNILSAYRFLCATHQPDDRIFLVGFSRGAYAVRALAGLIHMVGLLHPDQLNLANFALTSYKRSAERNNLRLAWNFSRIVGARKVTIHFLGLWDTVASLIVPRPDRFYLPSLQMLPFTRENPSVRAVRHAMAIDERRRLFRLNRWFDSQPYTPDPFAPEPDEPRKQDVRQVWFAGVHSDIGGGYPEAESGLSKFPLIWMVDEARAHGLLVDDDMVGHLARGTPRPGGSLTYVAPNAKAELHDSLTWGWWPLEWLPKKTRWRETRTRALLGIYLPRGERRRIDPDAAIDPSVAERRATVSGYDPPNLK